MMATFAAFLSQKEVLECDWRGGAVSVIHCLIISKSQFEKMEQPWLRTIVISRDTHIAFIELLCVMPGNIQT